MEKRFNKKLNLLLRQAEDVEHREALGRDADEFGFFNLDHLKSSPVVKTRAERQKHYDDELERLSSVDTEGGSPK
jgi:hypothetical protein